MALDFIVTNAAFRPRRIIDRQNAACDSNANRMCYNSAGDAYKAALKRKRETSNEFSVWIHGSIDPFATTATWGIIDGMKLIK